MTTTEVAPTFVGLAIKGDKTYGEKRVPQRPEEEFIPLLQAVLEDPTIRLIAWGQYTPYFNDGDPCVFHAHFGGVLLHDVKVEGEDDEDRDYEYDSEYYEAVNEGWPPYGEKMRAALGYKGYRSNEQYEGPDEARYDRIDALARAIDGGAFDDVLMDKFGDHAKVKVIPGKNIEIEFYEHD